MPPTLSPSGSSRGWRPTLPDEVSRRTPDLTEALVLDFYNSFIIQPQEHWTVSIVVWESHLAPVGACHMWKHVFLKCGGDANQCSHCLKVWRVLVMQRRSRLGTVQTRVERLLRSHYQGLFLTYLYLLHVPPPQGQTTNNRNKGAIWK